MTEVIAAERHLVGRQTAAVVKSDRPAFGYYSRAEARRKARSQISAVKYRPEKHYCRVMLPYDLFKRFCVKLVIVISEQLVIDNVYFVSALIDELLSVSFNVISHDHCAYIASEALCQSASCSEYLS